MKYTILFSQWFSSIVSNIFTNSFHVFVSVFLFWFFHNTLLIVSLTSPNLYQYSVINTSLNKSLHTTFHIWSIHFAIHQIVFAVYHINFLKAQCGFINILNIIFTAVYITDIGNNITLRNIALMNRNKLFSNFFIIWILI